MGRALRTRLDVLRPSLESKVCLKQTKQKQSHDLHCRTRGFKAGDTVWIRDFRGTDKWKSGVIVEESGPVSYMIEVQDGSVHKRHVDHIRHREANSSLSTRSSSSDVSEESPLVTFPLDHTADLEQSSDVPSAQNTTDSNSVTPPQAVRRNPPRDRRPPKRFQT